MAVVNLFGSKYMTAIANSTPALKASGDLMSGKTHQSVDTVETGAADSVGSTYSLARIPTNARISPLSRIFSDDLGAATAPTLNIGLFAVDGNFTSNATALNSALAANAVIDARLLSDIANAGKTVWEILGLTSDPGGFADVKVTTATAALDTAGTITLALLYTGD